jgi:hypothetical protein
MMTLSLTLLLGMLGLAVDVGWAYYRQQATQAAADAGATAAARAAVTSAPSGPTCTGAVWCGAATNCPATAVTSPSTSFDNACMLASANGFTTSGIDTVSVQAGVSSTAPSVSGPAPAYWVVVRVTEALPALFAAAFARGGLSPGATATAGAIANPGGGDCMYILDPSASGAFLATNGAAVTAACGIYVDSTSSSAMTITGATVTAPTIDVVGGVSKTNGGTTSVSPSTGAASATDPFKNLASPTPAGTCQNLSFTGNHATPAPGTYCSFAAYSGQTVTMSAGTYIVNGGYFSASDATITSTGGVFIYLTGGATVAISNGSTVTLSAETSGTYQGVLFDQDRTESSPGASTFQGGSSMNLTGSLYFPHSTLNINNGSASSTLAIVADMVNFSGGVNLKADPNGTKTGLSAGYTVSMIQ